jgi:hypothetical protein
MARWEQVEKETPKQTSDRITAQMQANAKAAQQDKAKKEKR